MNDKKTILLIIALGLVFVTAPGFFERLHSDEAVYWEVAQNLASGRGLTTGLAGGGGFSLHMPLPFFITAPWIFLAEHIFTARVVSSLFTVGSAVLIFLISARRHSRTEAIVGALLFIFSFQALRYGGRFYLDQYGAFFFLLALLMHQKKRPVEAGVSMLLAVLAREYWAGVVPFFGAFILFARTKDDRHGRFAELFSFCVPFLAAGFAWLTVALASGGEFFDATRAYLAGGAHLKNITASVADTLGGPRTLVRGWAELVILNALIVAGFVTWLVRSGRGAPWYLLLVAPQVVLLSLMHGFVLNGGVTQYPLSIIAAMAPFSGPGLKRLWDRFAHSGPARGYAPAAVAVITLQYIAFNLMATFVSLHQNPTVYGLGYADDLEVVRLLKSGPPDRFINGIHGAFVPDKAGWDWTDFQIDLAIASDPDWFITFENYVEVRPEEAWKGRVRIYNVGPYLMAEALERGSIKEALRQKDFPKWKLREN